MVINLLVHDLPQTLIIYFYYARYKPPSLDLRMENLIQERIQNKELAMTLTKNSATICFVSKSEPMLDICIVFLLVLLQCRNVYRYQKLFSKKRVRLLVFFSAIPVVIVTPVLKVSIVLATIFSQLSTYTSDTTFDPKKQSLINVTTSEIATEKIENEYDSNVIEFLDNSAIKKMFKPRHMTCVETSIANENGSFTQSAMPEPFRGDCLNAIEWCIISTLPFIVFGLLTGIFLFRKVHVLHI